jgi:hypothetical protein
VDFVVVGFGLGALAILIGVLMHGWLARRWQRSAARAATEDDRAADLATAAWRRDSGQALLTSGSALLIATVGALAGGLNDRIGAFFVTTTATVAALGLLLWGFLYRARHPAPPPRRARATGPSETQADAMSARVALPTLSAAVALAPPGLNGSHNGTDDALDTADVRVVPLDAVADSVDDADAPQHAMETDADADPVEPPDAAEPQENEPAVVLAPVARQAEPTPWPAVDDEDDLE